MNDKKFIVLTTNMINSKKIFNSLRQWKYKYTLNDDNCINILNSNSLYIVSEERFTFKEFAEQISKK